MRETVSVDIVVYPEWIHKRNIFHPVYAQISYLLLKNLFVIEMWKPYINGYIIINPHGLIDWLQAFSLFLLHVPTSGTPIRTGYVISDFHLNHFLLNLRTLKAHKCFLYIYPVICLKKANHVVSAEEERTRLFQFPMMKESQESWYKIPVRVSDSYCFPPYITLN